jgi:DNA-directed RNA polymerase specialized sigma24 family protein
MRTDKSDSKFISGIDKAAGAAYVEYYDALRRYLNKHLDSSQDVEDAVHEVYLRAIQNHDPQFELSLPYLYNGYSAVSASQ